VSPLTDPVKLKVAKTVERLADELEGLSHWTHDTPELTFEEEKAHAWLTEFLEAHGARVERGVGGLRTAFRSTIDGQGAIHPYTRISPDGVPAIRASSPNGPARPARGLAWWPAPRRWR
jgi:hypothetical protein